MDKTKNVLSEVVRVYLRNKDYEVLKQHLLTCSAHDVLEGLMHCTEDEQPIVFRLLPKDLAVQVFDIMEPAMQKTLIASFSHEQVINLLSSLDPVDQVRLLDEMPARVAKRLLDEMPQKQRSLASKLMGYEDGTVGRIMSPLFIDVKKDMTVKQARERIRKRKNGSDWVITTVYVTDETRKLEGIIHVSSLVISESDVKINRFIQPVPEIIYASDDQEEGAMLLQRLGEVELPVLDSEDRLIGVLTSEDAMDVISEEITDDMYDKVGLIDISKRESDRSYKLIHGGFGHVLAVRVPFLLITLAGGMLAGAVIDAFEEILEAVVATAIFIPVIMDMGGNVGTQSSTIFTRGVVLGHIHMNQFFRQWLKESLQGLGMGVILGALGGLVAALWKGMPELGFAVGISMGLTITLGIALGFLVPFFLIKLGFDQAAGADPIITTIKDMSGLAIYFTAVSFFLPHLIGAA